MADAEESGLHGSTHGEEQEAAPLPELASAPSEAKSFREKMLELVQDYEQVEATNSRMKAEMEAMRSRSKPPVDRVPSLEQQLQGPGPSVLSSHSSQHSVVAAAATQNRDDDESNMWGGRTDHSFSHAQSGSGSQQGDGVQAGGPPTDSDYHLPGFRLCETHAAELEKTLTEMAPRRAARLDRCVILPTTPMRVFWDVVLMVGMVYELWQMAFELAFVADDALPLVFQYVSTAVTVYFFADILLNFNTAIYIRDRVIMKRWAIAKHYFKTWFWLDLIASVPWSLLISNVFARPMRLLRFLKVAKLIKGLYLLRLFHTVRLLSQGASLEYLLHLRYLVVPVMSALFLVVAAHVHGCIWAALVGWEPSQDLGEGLDRYLMSFAHAYVCFAVGLTVHPEGIVVTNGMRVLDMAIATQRLFFLAVVGMWGLYVVQCHFQEDVKLMQLKENVMKYLQRHNVSISTRVQTLFVLQDTWNASRLQRHFHQLMEHNLPAAVHERVLHELWSDRLLSLGLVSPLVHVHGKFLEELSQIVREEVLPSQVLLFRYGDQSRAAHLVLTGQLHVVAVHLPQQEPDFRPGHWIGELALVNPHLRRNRTVVTQLTSSLMCVSAKGFHEVLVRVGLDGSFRQLCADHLAKGLCGRCGMLGDHHADACPMQFPSSLREASFYSALSRNGSKMRPGSTHARHFSPGAALSVGENIHGDLSRFLAKVELMKLAPVLLKLRCKDLETLATVSIGAIRAALPRGEELSEADIAKLSPESIQRFKQQQDVVLRRVVFDQFQAEAHYIFLSHSKMEAGTEAALMREELDRLLKEQPISAHFEVPIFLDADDLTSLDDVQKAVRKSHNLAVLLTNEVLSRPWVLIEIATAFQCKAQLLPVQVSKAGTTFVFPDSAFYTRLHTGDFLTLDGYMLLRKACITTHQVEEGLRALFNQIALPYSPHRPASVRQMELRNLLKRATLKSGERQAAGVAGGPEGSESGFHGSGVGTSSGTGTATATGSGGAFRHPASSGMSL